MIVLSASQIKTYRACTRKWALEKLAGLRGPETKSQTLGKDVDDNQLQPYLRDGRPFDFTRESGYIAASAMAWLPQPKWRGLEVQKHFTIVSPSSKALGIEFGYQGYMDLWLPFGGAPGFDNDFPVVGDFKTTKAKKWALTTETIREDVQAQLYAVEAILETKSKQINLDWIYMLTDGTRKSFPTQVTVHTDEVAEQFKKIEADGREMVQLRRKMPEGANPQEYALSLPGNRDACGDYGGCPFQHLCFKLEDLFDEPLEQGGGEEKKEMSGTVDLFAKLKKKQTQTGDSGQATEPATPPTQEQIAAEPALGINPPMAEGTPLAPPVGEGKAKRGRPAGSKNKKPAAVEAPAEAAPQATAGVSSAGKSGAELVAEMEANAKPRSVVQPSVAFEEAWVDLGVALKNFLRVIGVVA